MSEILSQLGELQKLDPRQHWFCGTVDNAEGDPPLEACSPDILRPIILGCFQLFALTYEEVETQKLQLIEGLDTQLGKCSACIIAYYKFERDFLERLRVDYEDDDVEILSGILHEHELQRIQRGLRDAAAKLQDLPAARQTPKALTRAQRHAIVEALTCEKFILDVNAVRAELLPAFTPLRDHDDLVPSVYLPGMAECLFMNEPVLSTWAQRALSRITGPVTKEDFDFAFRNALERILLQNIMTPFDPVLVRLLWTGMRAVVDHLDRDTITHCLRSLNNDVYKMALEHIQLDDEILCSILQTIKILLIKSPKDLWDAMGAIGPTTVAEQVFRSPRFESIMLNARAGDASNPASPLSDMLGWIEPFMDSLQIGNQPPVCRSLTDHILGRVRSNTLGPEARIACWREATRLLAHMLSACNESTSLTDVVGRAVAADALTCASAYIGDVLDILARPRDDQQARALTGNGIVIVSSMLALDCKILYSDRAAINSQRHTGPTSNIHKPETWQLVIQRLTQDHVHLARAILAASPDLLYLERIRATDNTTKDVKVDTVNKAIEDLFKQARHALDQMNLFTERAMNELVQNPNTAGHLVVAVVCTEASVHEAAVELMKAATSESSRLEALRRLLSKALRQPLEMLADAMGLLVYMRSFDPCPRLLRVCNDITQALCDSQDGLLNASGPFDAKTVDAIAGFWEHHWRALQMMAECSEKWNINHAADREVLREFVRDVMQTADALFDQFNIFNNVVAMAPGVKGETIDLTEDVTETRQEASTRALLSHPSEATEGIMRYLRLRDEFLLRTSAQLIRTLLTALTKHSLKLPDKTTDFLTEVAIYNGARDSSKRFGIKTLLAPTEIAGIAQDLESNAGADIVQQAKDAAMIERGMIADSTPEPKPEPKPELRTSDTVRKSLPIQPQKKQGTINFQSWGVQAEAHRDVERKRVPDARPPRPPEKKAPPFAGVLDRASATRSRPAQSAAAQSAFVEARKKARLEADRRRAEESARIKKGIPGLIAGQTAHEGSALARTAGRVGTDHTPKADMMVSSGDSSDSSSDEDEADRALFGRGVKKAGTQTIEKSGPVIPAKPRGPVKKQRIQRSAKDMRARLAPQMTGLYAKLLSWDFFHTGDYPPGSTRADFQVVQDTFRSAQEYRAAFESLLLLEAWSSFCKAREETSFRPFELKVATRISVDALFEVSVSLEAPVCKEVGILEADILVLSKAAKPTESPAEPHCLGRVSKVRFKKAVAEITIQIAAGSSAQSWISQGASIHAVKVESIITLEREYGALCGLEWYDLCHEIIRAEVSPILKYTDITLEKVMKNYRLNSAQAWAVQSAVDNDAFTLIQGPPGSGKTKTIVAIVGALLTQTLRQPQAVALSKPTTGTAAPAANAKKLLVCAPSNAAVDELVMRFMAGVKTADGWFNKPNVLRLGRSDRVNPQVLSVTLDEKINKIMNPDGVKAVREASELEKAIEAHKAADAELKAMYLVFDEANAAGRVTSHDESKRFEQLKRQKQSWSTTIERLRDSGHTAARDADIRRRQAEQTVLNQAQIICATLSGSARETFQHLTVDFESVVIDEAAQCIELSALIPLKYGCAKCIMVGDPKQLPPTVLSREAARFQYEQSLFVRMQRQRPNDVHLLDTQYRMHPAISRFPSRVFYDERLRDGPDMAALRAQPWHRDPFLGPYRFYHVAGRQAAGAAGHSLVNAAEVDAALALYRRLTAAAGRFDFAGRIGVITPYKSQLRLLRDRFSAVYGTAITSAIEFNTTDAFQGRESDIIIFSCVRAAAGRGIGFLADIRRMNVGITRAKSSLWVLGNVASLTQGEFWGQMIADARERGVLEEGHGDVVKLLRDVPIIRVDMSSAAVKEAAAEAAMKAEAAKEDAMKEEMVKMEDAADSPASHAGIKREPSDGPDDRMDLSCTTSSGSSDSELSANEAVPKQRKPLAVDHAMVDAPSAPARTSGTSTPKRKRSPSPPMMSTNTANGAARKGAAMRAGAHAGSDRPVVTGSDRGSAPAGPRRPPPARAPQRPRKPTGDDAMFIKPKRKW